MNAFVFIGSVVSGIISLLIIAGVLYSVYIEVKPADILVQWGGIIIGFYFGAFITLVKDIAYSNKTRRTEKTTNRPDSK